MEYTISASAHAVIIMPLPDAPLPSLPVAHWSGARSCGHNIKLCAAVFLTTAVETHHVRVVLVEHYLTTHC